MARRSHSRRRGSPVRQLSVRHLPIGRIVGFGALGMVGAGLALALAISGVTRASNPATALRFMPNEALALAFRADELLLANPTKPPRETRTLALAALRQQSLNSKALRVLGYYATAQRDEKLGGALIRAAAGQSRRDAFTQFWLIEDSVQRGNVAEALEHYDIALRTRPGTYTTLFPILLGALDDPQIRRALSPYIHNDRVWAPLFLVHATANSNNLPALVDLILESGGLGDLEAAHRQNVELLQRLVTDKAFGDARRLYLHMPGASAIRLADAQFALSDRQARFGPLGWQVIAGPDSGATFTEAADKHTTLSLFANAATTATVATKLLYLRPGDYDFAARLSKLEKGEAAFIRWQLRCPANGGERPVWALDNVAQAAQATLTVPADCPVQFLEILAVGGSGQNGMDATIDEVSLRPRGQGGNATSR